MPVKLSDADFQALRARAAIGSKTAPIILHQGKPAAAILDGKSWRPSPVRQAVKRTWQGKHKFNAKRAERDGLKFASKAEAAYFDYLKECQASGGLIFFLMQVRFDMPGSRYFCDYLEFWDDGSVTFTDVKGFQTEAFKIKRRAVEVLYPVKIRTCKMLKSGPRYDEEK